MQLAAALLLCAAAWLGPARSKERKAQFASWDEVNVIAHGLLQLGHGLKEHVDRTKGQLRELGGRLGAHNGSLGLLLRQAHRAQEQGTQLSAAVQELQGADLQLFNLSEALRQRMLQLAGEKAEIRARLEHLEGKLRQVLPGRPLENQSPAEVGPLQSLVMAQNLRIEMLAQKLKQQQYKLDKQNLQIKSLQSKVNLLIPLHLKGNKTQSLKWKINVKKSISPSNRSENASLAPAQPQHCAKEHNYSIILRSIEAGPEQVALAEAAPQTKVTRWLHKAPCPKGNKLKELPLGCHQLFLAGQRSSGVFQIQPLGSQPFQVYCDMTADGGWTVIQRRMDGSVDFDRLWEAYKNGFGDLTGDFWLGLEKIHHIVQEGRYHLLIELQDWEGSSQLIQFLFSLAGESTAYTLSLLGPLSGELENALGDFRQLPFSTRDQDNDLKADTNCAKHLSGGWWFSTCGHANLNGKYFRSIPRQRHERKQGIFWKTWKGRYYPLKSTTLKIQPADLETES